MNKQKTFVERNMDMITWVNMTPEEKVAFANRFRKAENRQRNVKRLTAERAHAASIRERVNA